jgi:hypothetical protein
MQGIMKGALMRNQNCLSVLLIVCATSCCHCEEPLSLEQYLAWANSYAESEGETLDQNRLIAAHQFEQYRAAMELINSQILVLEKELIDNQNAHGRRISPDAYNKFVADIAIFKEHLSADLLAIQNARNIDLSSEATRSTLKTLFREHLALHRGCILCVDLGLFGIHACNELYTLELLNDRKWNGEKMYDYFNDQIRRFGGQGVDYPIDDPLYGTPRQSHLEFLNSLWAPTVKNKNYEIFPPLLESQYRLDSKYLYKNLNRIKKFERLELVYNIIGFLASAGETYLTLPETLASLRNFLKLAASKDILKLLVAGEGGGELGTLAIAGAGGGNTTHIIVTIEEATALINVRGLRALATSGICLAMAGGSAPNPIKSSVRKRSAGRPRNPYDEPYPDQKIAGTNDPVPSPTQEQLEKLVRVGPPSPPFTTEAREAFKAYWQNTVCKGKVPPGFSSWNNFWDLVNPHHIIPRALGGTDDFKNLVPVLRGAQHQSFTNWWGVFVRLLSYNLKVDFSHFYACHIKGDGENSMGIV